MDESKPTRRNIEVLENLYHGRHADQTDGRRWVRNTGGAFRRMMESMAHKGWLPGRYTNRGYFRYDHQLTAAGLRALNAAGRDLPDFAERLAALEAEEAVAAAVEAEKRAGERAEMRVSAERRAGERVMAFREIMQNYQVLHDLTDDQCRAIWLEIVDREMKI